MKNYSFILLCFIAGSLYSQNQRPKDIKDAPQIKERIANHGQKTRADIMVSNYYGLDAQISALMTGNKIPSSCPTAINFSDKRNYIEVLNKWILENQHLVINEKKNVIITE